jgi:hypothetical protein
MSIFTLPFVTFTPKRSIDSFTAQMTIEEVSTDDLEITDHPVQEGAAISDHCFVKPPELTIQASFEPDFSTDLNEIYANLLALQASRQPFSVTTGKRSYSNMLMQSLTVDTDRSTENVLSVRVRLREIRLVQLEVTTTSVAPKSQQKTPTSTGAIDKAGQKSALPATEEQRRTAAGVLTPFQTFQRPRV